MNKIKELAPVVIALCLLGYAMFFVAQFIIGVSQYQQNELLWRQSATEVINKLIQPQNGN